MKAQKMAKVLWFCSFCDSDLGVPGDLERVLSHSPVEREVSAVFPTVPRIEAKPHMLL